MNLKKPIVPILILLLTLLAFTPVFSAESEIAKLLSLGRLPESPEFASVWDCVPELTASLDDEIEKAGVELMPEAIAFDRAIKVYEAQLPLSKEGLEEARRADHNLWRVPVARARGFVYATFLVKDGREVSYETGASSSYEDGIRISYIFDGGALDAAVQESGLVPEDAWAVSVDEIAADIIVIKAGGEYYAIPFVSAPGIEGVGNGKVCRLEELISAVGGEGPSDSRSNSLYILAAAALSLISILVCAAVVIKRKSSTL